MLSDWYKREKARKQAPRLLLWAVGTPLLGFLAVLCARWALSNANAFLSADQANFMVATLVMIAVPSFVFSGYCMWKIAQLCTESKLSLKGMLMRSDED